MSGFHTHMLIGAVGGLAAYKLATYVDPAVLSFYVKTPNQVYPIPPSVIGLTCVIGSAFLALWPDIDEPQSWISHRAAHLMWLLGAFLGFVFAILATRSLLVSLIVALVGSVAGLVGGGVMLSFFRLLTGGHRHLTHSLVVGMILLARAGMVWFLGYFAPFKALTVIPFGLAWGQALHLVGDIVTPEGVPLFYPFRRRNIHVFPHYIARFGELIVGLSALVMGFLVLWL